MEAEGNCLDARIHEHGSGATVLCKDATSTYLLEIDTTKATRTARAPLSALGTRHELVAAWPKALIVRSRHNVSHDVHRVLETGTGRVLATTHAGKEGGVASFPDGTAEIFGDPAIVSPSLRCLEGNVSKPVAACGERAIVKGKLVIDL